MTAGATTASTRRDTMTGYIRPWEPFIRHDPGEFYRAPQSPTLYPDYEKRISDLEKRVKELEKLLDTEPSER